MSSTRTDLAAAGALEHLRPEARQLRLVRQQVLLLAALAHRVDRRMLRAASV